MDSNDQNIEGVKPNENNTQSSGVDGFVKPRHTMPHRDHIGQSSENQQSPLPETYNEDPQPAQPAGYNKSGRGVKVFLVLFIVLFAASAATAGMFYLQYKQTKDDSSKQQSKISELTKQVDQLNASNSKSQVEKLTAENATLQKTIDAKKAFITTVTKAAEDLKKKCGAACNSIVIPTEPASTTSTNQSPSSSPATTPPTSPAPTTPPASTPNR